MSQTVYKAITLRWLCCSKMAAMSRAGRTFLALLYDTVWLCAINQLATAESHHSPTSWLFGSPVSSADLLLWPLTYAHAHRAALSKTPPPSPWPFSEMPPMPNQIVTCLHSTAQAMHSSELDSFLLFFFSHGDLLLSSQTRLCCNSWESDCKSMLCFIVYSFRD